MTPGDFVKMLLRHSRGFRQSTNSVVLGLAFIAIPYIVDVAFLGDLTPTHFAQENIVESKDPQVLDEKGPVSDTSDELLIAQYSDSSASSEVRVNLSGTTFCPTFTLTSASLVSRPPPACPLF